ncbi:MAG: C40 family peptidase [Chitinispirillales bacterium]|nr:C40 family peptidase [Chitinispirillales bacterium]
MSLLTCSENEHSGAGGGSTHALVEYMPDDLFDWFESLPDANITLEDVILPNGMRASVFLEWYQNRLSKITVDDDDYQESDVNIKDNILGLMSDKGLFLTERSNFIYPDEGENKPAQRGLAYVWGGKQINVRNTGTTAGSSCTDSLYGLDCSGLIHQLFRHAGINLVTGRADDQRRVRVLSAALTARYPDARLIVEDLGQIPVDEFVSGDIIYWRMENATDAHHIGMVLNTGGDGTVIVHSRGGRNRCEFNRTDGGPEQKYLVRDGVPVASRGQTYGIVRINVADAWTLRLRCEGRNYDMLSTTISIPPYTDFEEYIFILAADYGGGPLELMFRLRRNSAEQTLDLRLYSLNAGRVDAALFHLDSDDTGYVDMDRVVSQPLTCVGQVRLVRGNQPATGLERRRLSEAAHGFCDEDKKCVTFGGR